MSGNDQSFAARTTSALSDWLRAGGDWLFPPSCLACRRDLAEHRLTVTDGVCEECRSQITVRIPVCGRCSAPIGPNLPTDGACILCRDERYAFERAFALGPYDGFLRDLIRRAQQPGQELVARMLARQIAERWADELAAANVDVVVPVPQFLPQWWWRRYNAAAVLAEEFARILDRPVSGWSLVKTRWTPSQAQSSPSDRRQQQRGAFRVAPWGRLRGRTILLVDDVLTTGGTSQAATRALLNAGARKVLVAVVARGIGR